MSTDRDIERAVDRWVDAEISRRRLLRQAGAGALGLSLAGFLSACGDVQVEAPARAGAKDAVIPKGPLSKTLNFSNWPLYIDVDDRTGKRPTLEAFERRHGTRVTYREEINDNLEFFGEVRRQLARGDSGGRDLVVVTDWLAAKMKQLGYVRRLDHEAIPNVDRNLLPALRSPGYDPNRDYSVPWQSGMTGIAYRSDLLGGRLRSVNDVFDPKLKGRVTMLAEMRDTVGLVMLGMGRDPATDGVDAALAAVEKLDKARRDGQIRRFTGNDYTKDLLKGEAIAAISWSGDAIQLQADNPKIEFLQPEEGFMLFSDNMQIPVGAPHAYTAQVFMNYVYDPEVQARIAAYVNYVTPVAGVQEVLRKQDPELAEHPLIFPSDDDLKRARIFRELNGDEERLLDEAFQKVARA